MLSPGGDKLSPAGDGLHGAEMDRILTACCWGKMPCASSEQVLSEVPPMPALLLSSESRYMAEKLQRKISHSCSSFFPGEPSCF